MAKQIKKVQKMFVSTLYKNSERCMLDTESPLDGVGGYLKRSAVREDSQVLMPSRGFFCLVPTGESNDTQRKTRQQEWSNKIGP